MAISEHVEALHSENGLVEPFALASIRNELADILSVAFPEERFEILFPTLERFYAPGITGSVFGAEASGNCTETGIVGGMEYSGVTGWKRGVACNGFWEVMRHDSQF